MSSKLIRDQRLIRAILFSLLAFIFLPAGLRAQTKKIHRVGYLSSQSLSADLGRIGAFRQALRELGYREGESIVIEYRFAEGKYDRFPSLVGELLQRNVDVIVTTGAPPTHAAAHATKTIPIIMTVVGDPIEIGFVDSLARPGRNITGLTQMSPQLSGKRLELLKEAVPKVSRVAAFFDGTVASSAQTSLSLRETQPAAETLGIKLQPVKIDGPNPDFEGAFRTAASHRTGALIVLAGPIFELQRKRIADLATKSRLPAMYFNTDFVEAGGLMSYAPDLVDNFRRAAIYVDKVLKGSKPADLPVEQPKAFEFVINLRAAKQIGLTIPPTVLARADRIIR